MPVGEHSITFCFVMLLVWTFAFASLAQSLVVEWKECPKHDTNMQLLQVRNYYISHDKRFSVVAIYEPGEFGEIAFLEYIGGILYCKYWDDPWRHYNRVSNGIIEGRAVSYIHNARGFQCAFNKSFPLLSFACELF
jgi:hypothetical protein